MASTEGTFVVAVRSRRTLLTFLAHRFYVCHYCFDEFNDRSFLLRHLSHCSVGTAGKQQTEEKNRVPPRLNKAQLNVLHSTYRTIPQLSPVPCIPVLRLHRLHAKLRSPKTRSSTVPVSLGQSSFDDALCGTSHVRAVDADSVDGELPASVLNTKLSYHTYKYSRRERRNFYASVKRARVKKQYAPVRRPRVRSGLFEQSNFSIHLPTMINARQRLNVNANNSYPLIFDPHFRSLVNLSINDRLARYTSDMRIYFHLINSIASQEFQIIVNSNDNQQSLSYTAFSFIHLLRRTMFDFTMNLQRTMKRNHFQAFQHDTPSHPPLEILPKAALPCPILSVDPPLLACVSPVSYTSTRPIEHEHLPPRQDSVAPKETARIRIVNRVDEPEKKSPSRKSSPKKPPTTDENSSTSTRSRMHTRQKSIKTELEPDPSLIVPSFETKPVILSSSQLSQAWLTHSVFYRCHACAHEEFFAFPSRECINLHLSSKHGNMEENFKQRQSKFLNNQGRSLKIFQHYLKWQQAWPDRDVEQIFRLANTSSRASGRPTV